MNKYILDTKESVEALPENFAPVVYLVFVLDLNFFWTMASLTN